MNIVIYNEGIHDKEEFIKKVYPEGIHGQLKHILDDGSNNITVVTLDNVNDITEELLAKTDVMLWWGHVAHHMVPDEVSNRVAEAVQKGMGLIALHSAHMSKPFRQLMGTSCTLKWRDDDSERLWVTAPSHPIAVVCPNISSCLRKKCTANSLIFPSPTMWCSWVGLPAASCSAAASPLTAVLAVCSISSPDMRRSPPISTRMWKR